MVRPSRSTGQPGDGAGQVLLSQPLVPRSKRLGLEMVRPVEESAQRLARPPRYCSTGTRFGARITPPIVAATASPRQGKTGIGTWRCGMTARRTLVSRQQLDENRTAAGP